MYLGLLNFFFNSSRKFIVIIKKTETTQAHGYVWILNTWLSSEGTKNPSSLVIFFIPLFLHLNPFKSRKKFKQFSINKRAQVWFFLLHSHLYPCGIMSGAPLPPFTGFLLLAALLISSILMPWASQLYKYSSLPCFLQRCLI